MLFIRSCQKFKLISKLNLRTSTLVGLQSQPEFNYVIKRRLSSTMNPRARLPVEIPDIPLMKAPLADLKYAVEPLVNLKKESSNLLVVTLKSHKLKQSKSAVVHLNRDVDELTGGCLTHLVNRHQFDGEEGKTVIQLASSPEGQDIALLGLGCGGSTGMSVLEGFQFKESGGISPFSAWDIGKALAAAVSTTKTSSLSLVIRENDISPILLQRILEGMFLSLRGDMRFKSEPEASVSLGFLKVYIEGNHSGYDSTLKNAIIFHQGEQFAKELVNAPPNFCHPESLAKTAVDLAKSLGLEYSVLGERECVEKKMGAYLAVAQGSLYEPQFIHLTYKPEGTQDVKRIAFVGKGLCMDTGGYNLKVGCGIETMKLDMGGAAAVFGAAKIIGEMKPANVEVHFIVAAAENMISDRAYRPGDIVTAANGKTIEVGNTDAEGRLTLADALIYAEQEVKPHAMLDCATLTGAVVVGLGTKVAGLYGSNEQWMQTLLRSADKTGTAVWPLPLVKEYRKDINGTLADLNNAPSVRYGGSITAALFLKEFVKETPWCHLDMAGPAFDPVTKSATGYGAKYLAQIAIDESNNYAKASA